MPLQWRNQFWQSLEKDAKSEVWIMSPSVSLTFDSPVILKTDKGLQNWYAKINSLATLTMHRLNGHACGV